ncbi:hypothetical protein [Bacillus sp. AFS017336]|nr:hypothetical protein [Bacillus sp. AFS017336]
MKIIIEELPDCSETEITITCKELTQECYKNSFFYACTGTEVLGTLKG